MAMLSDTPVSTSVLMAPAGNENVRHYDDLLSTISTDSYTFLKPTPELHSNAISAVKILLDPLAADIADVQKARRDENRKKRKRGETDQEDAVLQLRQVYTSGLGVRQVWEQVKRILDAACSEVEREYNAAIDKQTAVNGDDVVPEEYLEEEEDEELDIEDASDIDDEELEDMSEDLEDLDLEEADEDIENLDEDEVEETDENFKNDVYVEDPNGLNDGFFSIDDFNKQTQFLEQQDARGEDDNPSDEDDVDWDADPLSMPLRISKQPKFSGQDEDEEEDEEEEDDEADADGPTFGNVDLNAPDSDDDNPDEEEDLDLDNGMPGLSNTNEIRYTDFFEPPPKKLSKTKRMRALPKTQPPKKVAQNEEEMENDMQRAIADVNRDLFEDEDSDGGSDQSDDEVNNKNLSTHEKQRATIAAEIRRLEAANVAKKDWALLGEARAVDRPINSLIEEDLEFERAGKPVPVITVEVSEEIEQLIKRRIIAREFDEVMRRRPDAIGSASDARRGRIEVDDSKPRTGLADAYEQDHLKSTDPGYVDQRSAATKKQHEEIDRLWKEVSSQLDLLTNLHFKPKRVEMEIKTVEDKPTISMEDARPAGIGGDESMLAPQEVYRPGEDGKVSREVVRKSGASVSREEMSREEKLRKRRRQKERIRKANGSKPTTTSTGSKVGKKSKNQEQQDILTELKKGNVKVISKKGELEDLGNQKRTHTDSQSSSALKL